MAKYIAKRAKSAICLLIVLLAVNIFGAGYSQALSVPISVTNSGESDKIYGIDNSISGDNVKILGIDPNAYPKIKVNIFVDELCAATGDLVKDDFKVEEDGNEVPIDDLYFTGRASGQKLDLAVVFDETDTMADEIDAMQSKVDDLTNKIKSSNIDARYSLVTFKTEVLPKIKWTDDADVFKREVNLLRASGGNYQRPEDSLGGVATALSFGFRPDAQKIIIVITDEPSMQRGDGWSNSTYYKDDVQQDLINAGVMLVAVSPDFRVGNIPSNIPQSDLPLYADMRELAQNSGGLWIDMYSADFSVILDQLEDIITGTYVIEYTSPATTTGSRTVAVSVNAPDCVQGGASSSYTTPASSTVPNEPPIIIDLISDKTSPQEAGSVITLTAEAEDPDEDQILYRFFLDDEPITDWTVENKWTWTGPAEKGSFRIEAQERDGMHAGLNGMDGRKSVNFNIIEQNSPPVFNDLEAEQDKATEITWTANATDPDGDQIRYRFFLNNNSMADWTDDNQWTLNTIYANVGENEIEVQIRDGKHSDTENYDASKSIQFKLSSMKLMVQTWIKIFGWPGDDIAYDVQQTEDGGYIFVGSTEKLNNDMMTKFAGTQLLRSDAYDTWIVKTDGSANILWELIPAGPLWDEGLSVQETTDNGYIIAGFARTYGGGITDVRLMKTNSFGSIEWDKIYGGSNGDEGISVQQVSDGGYIISGYTGLSNSSSKDVWLIRVDSSGRNVWDKVFGGWNNDVAYSVKQTNDSGYIATGWTGSYGAGAGDAWLIKTDHEGNKEWDRTFGGLNGDFAYSVEQTTDGGYIIAGYTESYGAGEKDIWLVKTDTNGYYLWDKTLGGSGDDWAYSVQQTSDGGYVIAGLTNSYGAGEEDVWLIKTDALGNKIWDRTFGGSAIDIGWSVKQTSDGGYIVVADTYSYGSEGRDVLLIKTDSDGNV